MEAMEYFSLFYSTIRGQKEGKLRNNSFAVIYSTSDNLNTTTMNTLDFGTNNTKTNDDKNVVSENIELWIDYKMSKTSVNTKSSRNCTRNSSGITYPKQQEQLNVLLLTTEFVSNYVIIIL